MRITGLKFRGGQSSALSGGSRGESVPCLFQLLLAGPCPVATFSPMSASVVPLPPPLLCVSCLCFPLIRTLVILFRVHMDNPG